MLPIRRAAANRAGYRRRWRSARQANGGEIWLDALASAVGHIPSRADGSNQGHAGADRLAMQQVRPETGLASAHGQNVWPRLSRAPEVGGLRAFVGGDDAGFGKTALLDRMAAAGRVAGQQRTRRFPRTR